VLVTGAGSGIGRGICEAVAQAGGTVVATDINLNSAQETADTIRMAGDSRSLALKLDVTDSASVSSAMGRTVGEFGRLDGLVANAGVLAMDPALEAADEEWGHQFEVNVLGVFTVCRIAARTMIEQGTGGAIVTIASNAGKVGYPNMAAYNASKAAVINLTRTLAAEWAEHRINVNAVCPGGVDTPMLGKVASWLANRFGGEPGALRASMTPAQLGRHVQPIEVGRVVAFLLSDDASIIRGQAINADGGDTPY